MWGCHREGKDGPTEQGRLRRASWCTWIRQRGFLSITEEGWTKTVQRFQRAELLRPKYEGQVSGARKQPGLCLTFHKPLFSPEENHHLLLTHHLRAIPKDHCCKHPRQQPFKDSLPYFFLQVGSVLAMPLSFHSNPSTPSRGRWERMKRMWWLLQLAWLSCCPHRAETQTVVGMSVRAL